MSDNHVDRVDEATASLRQSSVPDGPSADLQRATLIAMNQNNAQRRWMPLLRVAAVLVIGILLATLWLVWPESKRGLAFAQVAEKAQQTRSVAFTETSVGDSTRFVIREPDFIRGETFAMDRPESPYRIFVMNKRTGQALTINHPERKATKMNQMARPFDFYAWLKAMAAGTAKRIGDEVMDGHQTTRFEVTHLAPMADPPIEVAGSVWVDRQTQLPIRMELAEKQGGMRFNIQDIRFDLPPAEIADDRFSMAIPEGYAVQDMGGVLATELKAPPTTQEANALTITPGVGIGQLRFGDSRQLITDLLGKQEDGSERDMRYPSKGLAFMVDPRLGMINVVAFAREYAPIFSMNDFTGATSLGIKMGATRAQVEQAYGAPDSVESGTGFIVLRYDKLNGWFSLKDDKVVQIYFSWPREEMRKVIQAGGQAATQPATKQSNAPMMLTPLAGIGQLRFGDPKELVIQLFGKPEDGDEFELRYPSKGLVIAVHPRTGIYIISAYTQRIAAPRVSADFQGTTDKGIAMGAKRTDIEAIYGKPDKVEEGGRRSTFVYTKLNLSFTLRDGELGKISMSRPPTEGAGN